MYNGYLFQRGQEQERNPQPQPQPAYPPYTYYLTGTQEYLYSTFLRRLRKATRFSTRTASHILVFCCTIAGTTSLQIY